MGTKTTFCAGPFFLSLRLKDRKIPPIPDFLRFTEGSRVNEPAVKGSCRG